ncbi:hypothetical protein CC86DRAFT_472605 [Ophiobolus disseminans]|uniref:Ig-like domain-containing protein n=1 Tax=Ophiobolus disseminans TaxID=1469910 RepID=A0A6A6ZC85_9PLEO|nr:hypothetical protein CC86DRAFT_472605 [Ophiobolus disseminans]
MSLQCLSSHIPALTLLHPLYALAAQQGLPHEVFNVTQSGDPPVVTIREPQTINVITTESWTKTQQCPTQSSTRTIYSIVFTSPDASPIEVTTQSQVLTSYVPEMTWCVAPPMALLPVSAPYPNATTTQYTTIISGTEYCETQYAPVSPSQTCDQEITFSTECGFTLETPSPITQSASLITPAPTVKQVFTYWLVPLQSLTAGETPSDVDVKICSAWGDGNFECIRYQEVWEIVVVTKTSTTMRSIGFTATLTGPGTLIVETIQVFIENTTEIIDFSTTLLLETEIETESMSIGRKSPTGSSASWEDAVSTLFITKAVKHKSKGYACTLEYSRH